jgi:hypothetical protein
MLVAAGMLGCSEADDRGRNADPAADTPAELGGEGIKELRIPLEVNGFFYFLGYRKPIGCDATGEGVNPVDGVQVRLHSGGNTGDIPTQLLHCSSTQARPSTIATVRFAWKPSPRPSSPSRSGSHGKSVRDRESLGRPYDLSWRDQ